MSIKTAIIFMLISVCAFSAMNIVAKYLTSFNVYQIVFLRSVGTLLFTIPIIIKRKIPVLGKNKKLLLLRGILGVASITCFFQSLYYLNVGLAVALRYISPVFAIILAFFLLKERIRFFQVIFILLAFIGVLIIKNFGGNIDSIGLLFILLSALFLGCIFVVIRKLGPTENPIVIINYFMIMTFVFGGIMSIFNWKTPNLIEVLLFLSLGVLGYLGQLYMTKAFQSGETNLIAPLKYLEVIVSIVFGFLIFNERYSALTFLGIGLILFGLVINIYIKNRLDKKL